MLCEIPMAMNLKQARMVFEAAKENNVFFMEVGLFPCIMLNVLILGRILETR